MSTQYYCQFKGRVAAVRAAAKASPPQLLNGIEYVEVAPDQTELEVHFVHSLDAAPVVPLTAANVEIRGGVRVRDPKVKRISWLGEVMAVVVDTPGDFSPYVLRLVASPSEDRPPDGIDPALAQVEFGFKVDCPSDFDCRQELVCPPKPPDERPLDYLAKDYASFRRLMLDRIATLEPAWTERSPADLTVTLVELVAYRADQLSYRQDAVTAEAYLDTALKRVSVRRHARILDYPFHDGCNARTWVALEIDAAAEGQRLGGADPATGLGGTLMLTRIRGRSPGRIGDKDAEAAIRAGETLAFETMGGVTLYGAHNEAHFHTWSDEECCLPKGATRAFLLDEAATRLRLRRGDVLVFEETKGVANGIEADADRAHRHAVRLTRVDPEADLVGDLRTIPPERRDPVTNERYVEIEWAAEDALPFPLCLSARIGGTLVRDIAMARANVVLVDHGRTVPTGKDEALEEPTEPRRYRPLLRATAQLPLTWRNRVRRTDSGRLDPVDPTAPAAGALTGDLAELAPALRLEDETDRWAVRRDLLGSDRFARELVVETEEDGRAYLRFGDGVNGRLPRKGADYRVRYRVGNGSGGNVGAEAVAHVVAPFDGIRRVRNPLPARGGTDPHPILQTKLYAPEAFRRQERAVTTDDYARVVERHPAVQRAVATRRWTGSWHTIFITVDRLGGGAIDTELEDELIAFVERFRLAGHDVEIDGPRFVPLDIALAVCVEPAYFAADVEQRLLREFSAVVQPDGRLGFFHPDAFTFGAPVYLSQVVARAMSVPGVESVSPRRFKRYGRTAATEIDDGLIGMGRLEIARLDSDPNAPENGRIEFEMQGGA